MVCAGVAEKVDVRFLECNEVPVGYVAIVE